MLRFSKLTSHFLLLAGVLFGILGSQPALAQTQAINGSIRGRVTDVGAASVPQAKVTILNDDTGFTRQLDTDENGYYVFPNLPLGSYTVTIEKEGFDKERHPGVALTAGAEAIIDAQLKGGAVTN